MHCRLLQLLLIHKCRYGLIPFRFLLQGKSILTYAVADKLEFEDYRSGTLDSKLDELIDRVGEQSIQLYGRVDFTGDYDGAYLLEKGQHCKELTPEEVAIMDASDETLASELRRRGYVFDLQREQGMSMEL